MTIVYCDWATGNDTTGNGSAGNPYKTITKASTGLTGGDEAAVRLYFGYGTAEPTLEEKVQRLWQAHRELWG